MPRLHAAETFVKPTKVTLDDIDLANEISVVTTIKSLLDDFRDTMNGHFCGILDQAESTNNPVALYLAIQYSSETLGTEVQNLQVKLLEALGQVNEEDAHVLADPDSGPLTSILNASEFLQNTSKEDFDEVIDVLTPKEEKE
jgi:hypothetical protein